LNASRNTDTVIKAKTQCDRFRGSSTDSRHLITNGSFERAGRAWTTSSTTGWQIISAGMLTRRYMLQWMCVHSCTTFYPTDFNLRQPIRNPVTAYIRNSMNHSTAQSHDALFVPNHDERWDIIITVSKNVQHS